MRITRGGMIGIVFFGLLPFFTLSSFFYSDVNSKFFFVVFFADVLAILTVYHVYRGTLRPKIKGRFVLYALLLSLAVQYLSAYLGVFPERSLWSDIFWSSGVLFLTHLVALIVCLAELLSERDWSFMRRAIAASSGFFGFLTLIGTGGLGATAYFLWIPLGERSLTLGNETYAGAYLLIAFVITIIEFVRTERGSLWRKILGGSAILIALSPLLTNVSLFFSLDLLRDAISNPTYFLGLARSSSAALLAFLTFVCGYLLIKRFVAKRFVTTAQRAWGVGILIALMSAITLLFTPGSAIQNAYITSASAARPIVWETSWEAFQARPVWGWGPENFNYAFEEHFDNRLFQGNNLGEIWFERAHNIFLDTLVSVGIVGTAALALLVLAYLVVVYRAQKKKSISDLEAVLLYALVPAHLLQMQTGFDTVGSYTLLAFVFGYVLFLERQIAPIEIINRSSTMVGKVAAGIVAVLAMASLKFCLIDEYARQAALLRTITSQTAAQQKSAIKASLVRVSSFESLRISSASFIKGSLALLAEAPTPGKTKTILEFTSIYEEYYKRYLTVQPEHYRARVNYAYLLLIKTVLGENRLVDAKEVIRDSYHLSPGNPLTYILDSVAELYSGNLKEADRLMQQALAINPDIEFTQEAAAYLEKQKLRFPSISALKITNL